MKWFAGLLYAFAAVAALAFGSFDVPSQDAALPEASTAR
jgi:hypothetical protein